MVRFLVVYEQPTDIAAFDRHYFDVHVPLAKQLPGVRRYSVSRNLTPVRGPRPYHLVAELDWDDIDALRRDFGSPLGQQVARDADHLASLCPGMRSAVFDLQELQPAS